MRGKFTGGDSRRGDGPKRVGIARQRTRDVELGAANGVMAAVRNRVATGLLFAHAHAANDWNGPPFAPLVRYCRDDGDWPRLCNNAPRFCAPSSAYVSGREAHLAIASISGPTPKSAIIRTR